MKFIIYILSIFLAVTLYGRNTENKISASGIFNCKEIESGKEIIPDSYIISKIDSISKAETVLGIGTQLRVLQRYSFEELPCLYYYVLVDENRPPDRNLIPYYQVFFNSCDSSIYPFTNDSPRFSNVVQLHLANIIDSGSSSIIDLCLLYMYSSGRVPILLIQDYHNIWEETDKDYRNFNEFSEKYIKADIEAVTKIIDPTSNSRVVLDFNRGDHYKLIIPAWESFNGDVESWEFLVSKDVFEVENVSRKLEKKGPYKLREKDIFRSYENEND